METKKKCRVCSEDKDLSYFHKRHNTKDGHVSICKDCHSKYYAEYYAKNKEHKSEVGKKRYKRERAKIRDYNKRYCEENKERLNKKSREYSATHRESINKNYNKRRKEDSIFRLNQNVRTAIRISLQKQKKGRKWESLTGYSLNDLMVHLEKQFTKGMTWDNYGEWHIDHIIPLSIFNINGPESKGFKKAWALNNLRPLWALDNYKKNAKLFAA